MVNPTLPCPRIVVGLDLGDKHSHVFALDGMTGEILEDGKIATKPTVFASRFRGMEPARIVLEAGSHSPWVAELLAEQGHEVVVANPRRLQLITYGFPFRCGTRRGDSCHTARATSASRDSSGSWRGS